MSRRPSLHAVAAVCVAAFVLLAIVPQAGAAWRTEVEAFPNSGIAVEVASPYDFTPPLGALPVWVKIRNASGATHTWEFSTDGGSSYASISRHAVTESLRVENGQSARRLVLVPLDPLPAGYNYRSHTFRVEGYGLNDHPYTFPEVNPQTKNDPTPSIGMGEDLATPLWATLGKSYTDKGKDLIGSSVDLEFLPGDWRALAGFDALWLSDTSFQRLDAARRTAVHDWVSRGGLFCLCVQGAADPALRTALGLPPEGDTADQGLGRVQLVAWDGKILSPETVAAPDHQPPVRRASSAGADAGVVASAIPDPSVAPPAAADPTAGAWAITRAVGRIPVDAGFLIVFIVVFAVLVGPFNLFVFARVSRRHRLFWTTPLISLGASLLLMGFILLRDGFGGSGRRVLLCLILPDEKKTVVTQEQVARTGVVLGHGFEVSEDLLLYPVPITEGGPVRSYQGTGRQYAGDWFASRSVQAHRLEAVVPSRAEITLVNADAARDGAPPVLASNLPNALRQVRYLDAAGRCWVGDNLRTGERVTLRGAGFEEGDFSPGGSTDLDIDLKRLKERRGGFVAVADEGPFLATLPSIRWTNQRAVFAGPVTGARPDKP